MDWILLIATLSSWVITLWIFAGVIAYFDRNYNGKFGRLAEISRVYVSEIKPFYFVNLAVYYIGLALLDAIEWHTPLLFIFHIWVYYQFKDEGDDRWKRRKEKLLAKIALSDEGKLVVVPI